MKSNTFVTKNIHNSIEIEIKYLYFKEKGITTLRIYQYRIFHHTVIENCFEMLKSSAHEKNDDAIETINPPNFYDCTEVK